MPYLGSWKLDDQITFTVTTHSPTNGSGQDADSVPTYHVYEDETSTPLITGSMALLNGSNTIGFYSEQFQPTIALGFEKGKSYNIYVQAIVGTVTGTMSHTFQIEAEVDANSVSVPVTAGMVTGSVLGNVNGSVNSVTLPVGISTGTFLNAIADTVWDEILSGHLTNGSAGHILFSRMPSGTVLVGDKTGFSLLSPQMFDLIGNITGTITNVINVINPVTAGNVTGSVFGNVNGSVNSVVQPVGINTGTFIGAIADQVWDEAIAQHLLAGSTGEKLNAAGGAGDPWSTSLPGSYTPGQAGHILASRMPTGTVIVGQNNDKTGYFLGTPQQFDMVGNITGTFVGNISGSVGEVLTIGAALANKIADHVLRRSFANARTSSDGDAVSFRSLLGAIAKLVNRWRIVGTTLTVYQEDDSTALGTQALTGTAGADPITEVDTS